MWFSFLGTVLTVLFGVIISLVTEKISKTQILNLTAHPTTTATNMMSQQKCGNDAISASPPVYMKDSEAVFIVEKYRKSVPQHHQTHHLRGFDNVALNVDEP